MKFLLTFAAASSFATSYATPAISKRQTENAVSIAISAITDAVNDLDTAVLAIEGADDAPDVISAADDLSSTLSTQTADVAAAPELTQDEAFNLVIPINTLASSVQKVVDDVVAKKSIIVDNCFGQQTYLILQQEQSLALDFNRTAISKVPEPFPQAAVDLTQPLFDALASGISVYADQATPPASCSTTSATTSTSTSTSTTTTAEDNPYPTGPTGNTYPTPTAYPTKQCKRRKHR